MFDAGDRVSTPHGSGKVVYRRMAAPDYVEPMCYSVLLDATVLASEQPPFPNPHGTIVPASDVIPSFADAP